MKKHEAANSKQARCASPFYRAAAMQRRIAHGSAVVGCNYAGKAVFAAGSGAERNGKLREISLFPDLLAWACFRWNQVPFIRFQLKSTLGISRISREFPGGIWGGWKGNPCSTRKFECLKEANESRIQDNSA